MENWKRIIRNILLAFVFTSIGFALGKNFSQNNKETTLAIDPTLSSNTVSDKKLKTFVRVYYFHSTFRCTTCNSIEKRTKEILDSDFKSDIDDGLIQWKTDDFQKKEALAKEFDVIASCVVVALVRDDEVVYFKRLDDTWTLLDKTAEFDSYIKANIDEFLKMAQVRI